MCATRSLRTDMFSHTRMKRGDAVRRTSLSLRKLPRQFFYLCTIRSPTYTEPRPTATGSVLRIGHNALDVLHVGTRAVHGFTHAHERVLAEVFRARNCYKHKKRKMSTRHGWTVTSARTTVCVHCPLLLAAGRLVLLWVSKHSVEKLELGACKCE